VLQLAFGIFGPNPVSDLLFGIIAFLPRLFVAILIVVVAAAIGSAVRDLVSSSLGGLAYGRTLANLAGGTILVIGVFAALNQIRIAPAIVNGLFYALLAVIVGSAIVAIGGGGIRPMRRQWEKALDRVEEEARWIRQTKGGKDYEPLTREQLDELARDRDLAGRSEMSRDELAAALRRDDETHELRRQPAHEPPHSDTTSYDQLTHDDLLELAQERDLQGRSQMSKGELVTALRHDDRTHALRRDGSRTPRMREYEHLTREQLEDLARDRDLAGRSGMTKAELVSALARDDQTRSLRRQSPHEPPHGSTTDYEQLTHDELLELAQQRDLEGRSRMDKEGLAEALRVDDRTHELRRS
jgi:hypothetical protein